jgi:hypothetical protein
MDPKDHDLLISMNVKLDRVITDVRDLNDSTARRVSSLEQEKLDKVEADRLLKEEEKVHANHGKRIRFLERAYWIAIGALGLSNILLGIYLSLR